MKRLSVLAAAVCAGGLAASAQDINISDDSAAVPVVFNWTVSAHQRDFEAFMRCYGRIGASIKLLERIEAGVADRAIIDSLRRQGIGVLNETFAETYDIAVDRIPHLDLFDGETARKEGRNVFDRVAMADVNDQYERYRAEGIVSQHCLAVVDDIRHATS